MPGGLVHYLYKITNTENNKIYIGQTNDPARRWSGHKSAAKYRGEQVITRAITKYGHDKFTFEVIVSCQTQSDVDYLEEAVIQQYDARNKTVGYNVDIGGRTSPRTPEIIQKMSEGLRKYYETHDGWNKGGTLTEEWKQKISEAHMGLPGTNLGKTFSQEWSANLSKSTAGKPQLSKRKFSEEVEQEICRLYVEEEKSTYALGKQFECQRTTIASILERNNVEARKSNYTGHVNNCNIFSLEQELEICRIYSEENISRRKLAKQFKCGKTTIRDILLRNNIKT